MKASTKTASVSTSTKAAAKATAPEVVTIKVPASVFSAITSLASADASYQAASTSREKTIIVLGSEVQKTMSSNEYEAVRLSLKPLMEAAFGITNKKSAAPKEEKALALYVGQQLARVMSVAYPGGKAATPAARKAALQQFQQGQAANLPQTKLLELVAGRAKLAPDKSEGAAPNAVVLVPVKKDENRGGHNAKTPIETLTATIGTALTAAKTADIDREQILVIIADALIALELMDKETESLEIVEE